MMMKKVAKGQNPHAIGLLFFFKCTHLCTKINGHAPWIATIHPHHQPPAMKINPDINQTTEHILITRKMAQLSLRLTTFSVLLATALCGLLAKGSLSSSSECQQVCQAYKEARDTTSPMYLNVNATLSEFTNT